MTATTRTSGEKLARNLELTNVLLAAIAIVVVHLLAGFGELFNGAIAGALIGILNLRAMVWLTRKLIAAEPGSRTRYGILFAVKLLIVGTVVWLVLSNLPVDSVGFVIGFSSLLPSALWVAFLRSLEPAPATAARSPSALPSAHGKSRFSAHQEQRS